MSAVIRFGVLRLVDSAPAVLAHAEGLFAAEGLEVVLHVEPSWANIADKLAWGALDAAIILAPLALAAAAGLRGPPTKLRVPMGISRAGNTIVVGPAAAAALPSIFADAAAAARDFAAWIRAEPLPPRFAVVHVFSMHNLLLRHWLAAAGIDPDRDLEIVVVPPEDVVAALDAGRIAGFSAGAPWGDRAVELGAGRVLVGSSAIRPGHTEKWLAIAGGRAGSESSVDRALVRALRRAQALCADADRATSLASLLASRLHLPEAATRAALPGGRGREHVSFVGAACIAREEALWSMIEMRRWGWFASNVSAEAVIASVISHG